MEMAKEFGAFRQSAILPIYMENMKNVPLRVELDDHWHCLCIYLKYKKYDSFQNMKVKVKNEIEQLYLRIESVTLPIYNLP